MPPLPWYALLSQGGPAMLCSVLRSAVAALAALVVTAAAHAQFAPAFDTFLPGDGYTTGTPTAVRVRVDNPAANLGACCARDTTCLAMTAPQCQSFGGVFRGTGAPCTPATCPITLPTGACCTGGGLTCTVTSLAQRLG